MFILGPSHHECISGCALSACETYETPIGNLTLDLDTIKDLKATGSFEIMSQSVDENEHSIEMHLPYLRYMMDLKGVDLPIVPVLVGSLGRGHCEAEKYAKLFEKYADDSFFIISSDFCHWGERFGYTPCKGQVIDEYITELDHQGIEWIEKIDPKGFLEYLSTTRNTICGRNPILILLHTWARLKNEKKKIKAVHYRKSGVCETMQDSSVSYASFFCLS